MQPSKAAPTARSAGKEGGEGDTGKGGGGSAGKKGSPKKKQRGAVAAGMSVDVGGDNTKADTEVEIEEEEGSAFISGTGRGRDGPTGITLPAYASGRSNNFCLLVDQAWREARGFRLFELEGKIGGPAKDGSRSVQAREWYCAKEVEPDEGGFQYPPLPLPGVLRRCRVRCWRFSSAVCFGVIVLRPGLL